MNEYLTLINLIKCLGLAGLGLIVTVIIARAKTPTFPDDDGERM